MKIEIDVDTQKSIQERIIESSEMRLKSEQLLDLAKTSVEKALEENEESAFNYIIEKLAELKITINHE